MKPSIVQLIISVCAAITAVAVYSVWFSLVSGKSAEVAALQEQIAMKTETAGRIARARLALGEITEDEAAVKKYFVPESGIVQFIKETESIGSAQSSSVAVQSVSAGKAGAQPVFILSLSISGPFDAVMRTVGAIEYAPYDLYVSGLSLSQDEQAGWRALLNLTVGSVKNATTTAL